MGTSFAEVVEEVDDAYRIVVTDFVVAEVTIFFFLKNDENPPQVQRCILSFLLKNSNCMQNIIRRYRRLYTSVVHIKYC